MSARFGIDECHNQTEYEQRLSVIPQPLGCPARAVQNPGESTRFGTACQPFLRATQAMERLWLWTQQHRTVIGLFGLVLILVSRQLDHFGARLACCYLVFRLGD